MNTVDKYLRNIGVVILNVFGWFILLMIPALEITTCTMGSEDAWSLTAIFYMPFLLLVSLLLLFTRKIEWAKWLSIPQIVLIPWAVFVISRYLVGVTVQGNHFCAVLRDPDFNNYASSWWAPYWAPAMLVVISVLCASYIQVWRGVRHS
jgi:hypothetical protein